MEGFGRIFNFFEDGFVWWDLIGFLRNWLGSMGFWYVYERDLFNTDKIEFYIYWEKFIILDIDSLVNRYFVLNLQYEKLFILQFTYYRNLYLKLLKYKILFLINKKKKT